MRQPLRTTLLRRSLSLFPLPLHSYHRLKTTSACSTLELRRLSSTPNIHPKLGLIGKKALIIAKWPRYDVERMRFPSHTDEEFAALLRARGTDPERLKERAQVHHANLTKCISLLSSAGLDIKFVINKEFSLKDTQDASIVFSAGGDGTFLDAAARVSDSTPLIGINTDPGSSKGELCLSSPHTSDPVSLLSKCLQGHFKWLFRQRIRVIITRGDQPPQKLSTLALNDIYIGERSAHSTSYFSFSVDNRPPERQKSSGIIVFTGTGSSGWAYNDAKVSNETVLSILRLAGASTQPEFVQEVTTKHNERLLIGPEEKQMGFFVRAPINNGIFEVSRQQGLCKSLHIQSRNWNGVLVLDGSEEHAFDDGDIAELNIDPAAQLRTVRLFEASPERNK
eukprot:m.86400 g.86400  ORF g.86400 m.86400 type:complete len:394 (+) comp21330_c0_seq2:90-1271(+)